MASVHHQIGEHLDVCNVCRRPIHDLSQAETREYGMVLLTFCSAPCLARYLEDPAHYAEFADDDDLGE